MSTYYVNISNAIAIGDGSIGSPLNYNQLVNFFNPEYIIGGEVIATSAQAGDVIKVKGSKTEDYAPSDNTYVDMFVSFHESLSGSFSIEGWDVLTEGSPILYNEETQFSLFGRANEYKTSAIDSTLDITLKNILSFGPERKMRSGRQIS